MFNLKENLRKTRIEKESWFNNKKDFIFNENPHTIINNQNNLKSYF